MNAINIHEQAFELSGDEPTGFLTGEAAAVRAAAAGGEIAVRLYELPPGEALCPYHYEFKDEWLLVLDGEPTLRDPDGRHQLRAGDLVRFPLGPDGAHQLINRGSRRSRVLMWSTSTAPEICVYPDSDKIAAYLPERFAADELLVRRADGHVPYWEGERAPD